MTIPIIKTDLRETESVEKCIFLFQPKASATHASGQRAL